MDFPSDEAILALHKKYAPNERAFTVVYRHCQVIDEIAKQLIERNHLKLNTKLVHSAALIHDIGYYPLLDENGYIPKCIVVKHGVAGAEILRKERVSEAICRIVETHVGLGLTKEYIIEQNLPLPHKDLVAETPEEWLITYADKLHTKAISADDPHNTLGWFVSSNANMARVRKFGEANAACFARLVEKYGTPDLGALAKKHNQELK